MTITTPGLLSSAEEVTVVPRPSKKVRRRRRLVALFLTLAVFVTAVAIGAQFLKPLLGNDKPTDYPGPGSGEVRVSVDPGEGTRSMAAKLENGKVVANADTFLQAFTASGGILSPGDYTFKQEMKNSDAVNVLLGHDKSKVIYFALSAGLRIGESLQAISEGSGVPLEQLTAISNVPAEFGLPANAKNLEGFLAPGEYRFELGTPAKDILKSLVKVTVDELVSQGITDPAKQYEAVIVASIVQAEGGQAEYGDVAGAIYNRLKPNDQTNGYLQVDSAVTYGLGTKSFNFTDEERKDKSNVYNTYANPGLPARPYRVTRQNRHRCRCQAQGQRLPVLGHHQPGHQGNQVLQDAGGAQRLRGAVQHVVRGQRGPLRMSLRAAVLGHPISHSKSPALHLAAYAKLGIDIELHRH